MSKGYGKIVLDLNNVEDAIKQVAEAKKWVENSTERLLESLAIKAGMEAQTGFDTATFYGNNDVTVTRMAEPHSQKIRATGHTAAFIEFGAGATTVPYPVEATDIDISEGSWSRSEFGAGQYEKQGFWIDPITHQKLDHQPPNRPMFHASEAVKKAVAGEIKGVFNQ